MGGCRARSLPAAPAGPGALCPAMLPLSVKKMVCEERLVCTWLGPNLTLPLAFTERLVGAFWDRKKWGGGREETCKPGCVLPDLCRGIICESRPWQSFGGRSVTLLRAQQEAEGHSDVQGPGPACSDLVMEVFVGRSLGSSYCREHLEVSHGWGAAHRGPLVVQQTHTERQHAREQCIVRAAMDGPSGRASWSRWGHS